MKMSTSMLLILIVIGIVTGFMAGMLGIGGARIRAVAPDRRIAHRQRAVGHDGDRLAQRRHADIAMADIRQILGGHP